MTCIRMTGWIVAVALLAVATVSEEAFYLQDGVVFEGTIRQLVPEAATKGPRKISCSSWLGLQSARLSSP